MNFFDCEAVDEGSISDELELDEFDEGDEGDEGDGDGESEGEGEGRSRSQAGFDALTRATECDAEAQINESYLQHLQAR